MQRDTESVRDDWSQAAVFTLEHDEPGRHSYSVRIAGEEIPYKHAAGTSYDNIGVSKDCGMINYSAMNRMPNKIFIFS